LYDAFLASRSAIDFENYKKKRNRTNNLTDRKNKNYFLNKFNELTESKPIWRVVHELNGDNIIEKPNLSLKVNNIELCNSVDISEELIKAFLVDDNVSSKLGEEFEKSFRESLVFFNKRVDDKEVTINKEEIRDAAKFLKFRSGHNDVIPAVFIKNTLPALLLPLSILFTFFIRVGQIPDSFKKAVSFPLYKNIGSRNDPKNYRLISNLPLLSKLFERVIKARVMAYIEKEGLLCDEQHGFRTRRSCMTAMSVFTQKLFEDLNKGKIVLVLFVDLRKAFDFVVHALLFIKLRDIFKMNYYLIKTFID